MNAPSGHSSPDPAQPPTHGLMLGEGFYNRHAWLQAGGVGLALPVLARAAGKVPVEAPLVIADYGASQGRNSLKPMQIAIDALRARSPELPITVVHTDQPGNDFSSLFTLLDESPESYLRTRRDVYTSAIGRSFFQALLPPATVTLGWSSYAAHWLSRVPVERPGHIWPRSTPRPCASACARRPTRIG